MGRFGGTPAPIFNRRTATIIHNKGYTNLDDLISVSFNAKSIINLIERETMKQRSPAFYAALKRANERAAKTVQKGMRDRLREEIGDRPQRPGHRLERSIMNEANRVVHSNTFMVGIEAWMNKSPSALYWRQIEEGMGGYTARVLFTNTGGATGAVGPPWVSPGSSRQLRMGQFSSRGGSQKGVLVHFEATYARKYSRGGSEAFQNLDMGDLYIRHLRAAGITNVSRSVKSGIFKEPTGK